MSKVPAPYFSFKDLANSCSELRVSSNVDFNASSLNSKLAALKSVISCNNSCISAWYLLKFIYSPLVSTK